MDFIVKLSEVNSSQISLVGGKNASLGEMIQQLTTKGIKVPDGFATTSNAFNYFLAQNNLDKKISALLKKININNLKNLNKISFQIRKLILATPFWPEFENEVAACIHNAKGSFAIRSSATFEDLPNASFAGQQESYLNVQGFENILKAIKLVFASLFTSRAITYRIHQGFPHHSVAISAGIQPMVRSDKGVSGVLFTLDTESGFDKVILINSSYGLGELVVQGRVNPDEFYVYKPALIENKFPIIQRTLGDKSQKMIFANKNKSGTTEIVSVSQKDREKFSLSDKEIETLARYALIIENHYQHPMDIEWAKDGITNEIYILQARPETVKHGNHDNHTLEQYSLKETGPVLTQGLSIGQKIGAGKARIILDPKNLKDFKEGEVLVTDITDPDWEPIMKKASAIVTNKGGRTCHAAIVARELGIPAVVGCGNATKVIKKDQSITVTCAESTKGTVYLGKLAYELKKISIKEMPELPVKVCINLGNPDIAFATQYLPNHGVGLARLEFIISNIGLHPNAAIHFKKLPTKIKNEVRIKTSAYTDPIEYYIEKLREGVAKISAAFYPKPVIFRFSDFKSNEYAHLLGGHLFEESEENPMLGFRGASRYKNEKFQRCFELECQAFNRVRDEMGLTNAQVMIPFVRTLTELEDVITLMGKFGLSRDKNDLKIYMMCEIPANVILADEFLKHVDGFSIGSNDLTQLILGLDRDSTIVAPIFDERNAAVKHFLQKAIDACKKENKYIGICGQGPSDYPDFAEWLMSQGIGHISLNPDSVVTTWLALAEKLKKPALNID